jgi:hypothetical protein
LGKEIAPATDLTVAGAICFQPDESPLVIAPGNSDNRKHFSDKTNLLAIVCSEMRFFYVIIG